jgi:predicted RNA-binding protein with PIN domain
MRYTLVDGHSVIFAWPELRKLHQRRNLLGREELIKLLTEYQDASGIRVVVVFDGQGAKVSEETAPGGIQIFYAAKGQTADAVIERLVAVYGQEHDLTVVTDDHLERDTTSAFGAYTLSSETFRAMLAEARGDLDRELKKFKRNG